jgi:LmbE family N-acetylglucosaminyl deacetylase
MSQNVLVVAAHPDDEVLGCGGSMARHSKQGDIVSVLILADGVSSRTDGTSDLNRSTIEARKQCAQRANTILGTTNLLMLAYPDNCMDTVPLLKVVQAIEQAIENHKPTIVYTHHSGDVNVDHCLVHDAVIAACRPQPGQTVRQLLFFETPSSTEWRPPVSRMPFSANWFNDVSDTINIKLEALAAYGSEMRGFPHPRSLAAIEHLARWRGACVGLAAAEAFELGRLIQ